MTEPLFLRVVLQHRGLADQLWDVLRRWPEMARRGRPLQVVVSEYAPTRTEKQNEKMWTAYLKPIAAQAKLPDGSHTDEEGWHKIMKVMFLPEMCAKGIPKWKYQDSGERLLVMSTGDLNETEFEEYLHAMGSYATTDRGVRLPANPRDLAGTPYESEEPK